MKKITCISCVIFRTESSTTRLREILCVGNNPEEPKILCVGNNPDRQNIYGAALGLYNSRIVKLINKKGMLKSSVIIDELPTIYFKGLDSLIPPSKISGLTQGMFVGSVSDNFDERIEHKIFHAEIVVDNEKVAAETKAYKPIPVITDFTDEVKQIVKDELARIANDDNLKHLLKK